MIAAALGAASVALCAAAVWVGYERPAWGGAFATGALAFFAGCGVAALARERGRR